MRSPLPALVFPIALLLPLTGCEAPEPAATGPQPVLVVHPQRADESLQRYPGEVRARHETALAFRVGGKVTERLVDVGDRVAEGDPLARLDAEDLRLRQQAASARLDAAEAALRVARTERERYQALLGRQLVSQSQFDAIDNRYRATRAEVEQARAQRQVASNQLDYAVLTAHRSGVIATRAVEAGQVVAPGQMAFLLAVDGEREVAIDLPEQRLDDHRLGQPALIELWSQPGIRYQGHLRELAPAADPASRTFSARVAFDRSQAPVDLGQSALVTLRRAEGAPLAVPLTAVSGQEGQPYVWRVREDATLERVNVRLGPWGERLVPVLEGLAANDWIVLAGVHLLHAGQVVQPLDRDNRPLGLPGE